MYRTNDPRFRRRLNEIGQTLENANETAQSGIYIFGQTYIKPCFQSIGSCLSDCVDAGCPALNLQHRDRLRRQRGRARSGGRAELSFDFYDDWDEDENDGLLGWNSDEFDRVVVGTAGYGTVTDTQPARPRGMNYPKARRKSNQDIVNDPSVIPGSSLFTKLFGGKSLKYKPSAAGLQEHPGARRRDITEGEALLEDSEPSESGGAWKRSTRNRSGTAGSRETQDSFSSRGDIFPSDDENDAVPLDDEFAMILERRATGSGNASGPDTENSSERTGTRKKGKRPSAASSRRTYSSRSGGSGSSHQPSRTISHTALPTRLDDESEEDSAVPTLVELQREDVVLAEREEAEVERKRSNALRLAAERGLVSGQQSTSASPSESSQLLIRDLASSQQGTSASTSEPSQLPIRGLASGHQSSSTSPSEPSQLPTPTATDDEDEESQPQSSGAPAEPSK